MCTRHYERLEVYFSWKSRSTMYLKLILEDWPEGVGIKTKEDLQTPVTEMEKSENKRTIGNCLLSNNCDLTRQNFSLPTLFGQYLLSLQIPDCLFFLVVLLNFKINVQNSKTNMKKLWIGNKVAIAISLQYVQSQVQTPRVTFPPRQRKINDQRERTEPTSPVPEGLMLLQGVSQSYN